MEKQESKGNKIEVPHKYLCPITQELMVDPVFTADGHTYERKAIEKWLEAHDTSPKTNLLLEHKRLALALSRKQEFSKWLKKNKICTQTEFLEAVKSGQFERLQNFNFIGSYLTFHDEEGRTALHWAVYDNHLQVVGWLVSQGAALTAKIPENGFTPIHVAAQRGYKKVLNLLLEGHTELIEDKTQEGKTVLHLAAEAGHEESVELLIALGAKIGARTVDGKTALQLAALAGYPEIVEILKDKAPIETSISSSSFTAPLLKTVAVSSSAASMRELIQAQGEMIEKLQERIASLEEQQKVFSTSTKPSENPVQSKAKTKERLAEKEREKLDQEERETTTTEIKAPSTPALALATPAAFHSAPGGIEASNFSLAELGLAALERAKQHFAARRYYEAADDFETAFIHDPSLLLQPEPNCTYFKHFITACLNSRQADKAKDFLGNLPPSATLPNYLRPFLLASVHYKVGAYREAISEYEKAIQFIEEDEEKSEVEAADKRTAWQYIGHSYALLCNTLTTDFSKLDELIAKSKAAFDIAIDLAQSEFEKAKELYHAANSYLHIARALKAVNRIAEADRIAELARQLAEKAQALGSSIHYIRNPLATYKKFKGEPDSAIDELYEISMRCAQDNKLNQLEVNWFYSSIYMLLENQLALCLKAIEVYPDYAEAYARAATLYQAQNNYIKAAEYASQHFKRCPSVAGQRLLDELTKKIEAEAQKPKTQEDKGVTNNAPVTSQATDNPKSENEKLFEGVRAGSIDKIDEALREGADINATEPIVARGDAGFTPLHVASVSGNRAIVQHLLDCGAYIEARNQSCKSTALHQAVYGKRNCGEIVKLLIKNHADIEALDHTDFTPLHYAVYYNRPESVKILLASGANAEARTGTYEKKHHYRLTPLAMAWSMHRDKQSRLEIIEILTTHKNRLNPQVLSEKLKCQKEKIVLLEAQVKALKEELKANNDNNLSRNSISSKNPGMFINKG